MEGVTLKAPQNSLKPLCRPFLCKINQQQQASHPIPRWWEFVWKCSQAQMLHMVTRISYRGSSHPKLTSDYTLYKEAIPVKGLLWKKRQKEVFLKNKNNAIFRSLNFSGQRLHVKLSVCPDHWTCARRIVQPWQCLSDGYLRSLNSENGKIHFNSRGTLKKCTFLTILADNLQCSTAPKKAQHALPSTRSSRVEEYWTVTSLKTGTWATKILRCSATSQSQVGKLLEGQRKEKFKVFPAEREWESSLH